MSHNVGHEALRYRNQEFAIHHLIADCPPATVIRELVKNAEENAMLLQPPGRIEWFVEQIEGVPKLGLYNEGPGMRGPELWRLMDLASTGKKLGIDNNYGQGGKISALKVSPHGVVFRSCTAGRVSQIVLAAEQRPGLDFPVHIKKPHFIDGAEGNPGEGCLDVTDRFIGRADRPLDRDWTEVVLLGQNASHDTVSELLPEIKGKNWLMRLLHTRFFRFHDGIVVHAGNLTTGSVENRNAQGLERLTESHSEKQETVCAAHPRFGTVQIRYCKLRGEFGEDDAGYSRARTMEAYGLGSRGDHVSLVWKDECYDMHAGWSRISGAFGFTFGSSNVAIQILLPETAPVKNNTYRNAIIERGADHQPVRVEAFADLVRRNRPAWLVKYVEREARRSTNPSGVPNRLKAFLDELKATGEKRCAVEGDGDHQGEVARRSKPGVGSSADTPHVVDPTPPSTRPGKGRRLPSQLPGVPQVSFAEDPGILEEMTGRAAMYRREENAVFLNQKHFKYREDLERILEDAGASADRRSLAKQLFDEEYSFNAGKFVIQAWLFKGKPHWEERAWEESVNMGALTVHLAEPVSLAVARRRLRQKLNSRKMEMQDS